MIKKGNYYGKYKSIPQRNAGKFGGGQPFTQTEKDKLGSFGNTVYNTNWNATTISSTGWQKVHSVDVGAGTWLIIGHLEISGAGANAPIMQMSVGSANNGAWTGRVNFHPATSGSWLINTLTVETFTSTTSVGLWLNTNTSNSITSSSRSIYAIKIG